ncbi:MAG: hypothetical protein COA79_17940 [Planctomycetota bacterium]|nr:MAG: hypothetical protein COA79_17940 [Planctomycetota bacterium]
MLRKINFKKITRIKLIFLILAVICIASYAITRINANRTFIFFDILVAVQNNLEDLTDQNDYFTPTTLSFLRGYHWLEKTKQIKIKLSNPKNGIFSIQSKNHFLNLINVDITSLLPRFYYTTANKIDSFDRFNLMMAEYSRNGLNMSYGEKGDKRSHFETSLDQLIPFRLGKSDYDFQPNEFFRPLRFSITNNCLASGLWEINATDRAGEIYHGWFNFPDNEYFNLVANANNINFEEAKSSLEWHENLVLAKLERLRHVKLIFKNENIKLVTGNIGYSTQNSRRKISNGFVRLITDTGLIIPEKREDIYNYLVIMPDFMPPGKYSKVKNKTFNFSFLGKPREAKISITVPKTDFRWNKKERVTEINNNEYIEIEIPFADGRCIVIGNLPLWLLVNREDFAINGFGVGILSATGVAERRQLLLNSELRPSFAYLTKEIDGEKYVINSHSIGLEQIFIRSHPFSDEPHWEIVISSFERIVDLAKYRVSIPKGLIDKQKIHSRRYTSPLYLSYKDDNLK